jgi:uncharacterized MAPEG superfamily protein
MEFVYLPAWKPYVLFAVLLVLKMGAVGFYTARARAVARVVQNPEDVRVNPPGTRVEPTEASQTQRAKRAHQNDLENIPSFLFLGLLFVLLGGSALGGWAYFAFYFVARTLHTIFYLRAMQPWRTAAFTFGQLAVLGLMVQLLMAVATR